MRRLRASLARTASGSMRCTRWPVSAEVKTTGAPTAVSKVKGGQSRLRVQYVTQVGTRPPKFVVFTAGGRPGLHFSYERYLLNRLREEFDFYATPIRIVERHRKERKK